jgi:S1-C subfamily serine protease
MKIVRKVLKTLFILMGFLLVVTTPGCTKIGPSFSDLKQKIRDVQQGQECCYLEYGVKEKVTGRANKVSRESAVKVAVRTEKGRYRGTGTYFVYKGHHIVITAGHLFAEGFPTILKSEALITAPNEKVVGSLAYFDPYTDVAIFRIAPLESRKPAKFVRTPKYVVGDPVVYSGFPGSNNLLTLNGEIAGDGFGTDLAIQSFAWGGSSGSGVFDEKGRFVGVVVSIMVGRSLFGYPEKIGSIVYVAPANLIDMVYLRQNLDKLEVTPNDGF